MNKQLNMLKKERENIKRDIEIQKRQNIKDNKSKKINKRLSEI